VIIALVVVAIAVMIVYSTVHGPRYRVEVCMAYQGRSACKKVAATSEQAALRSGMENACADIASGVTDSMNCTQAQPLRVTWLARPNP
jgi:hypothetical protein